MHTRTTSKDGGMDDVGLMSVLQNVVLLLVES
jgi:hypothetical protein